MKYFSPIFFLCVALIGLALSVSDLSNGDGDWLDILFVLLHCFGIHYHTGRIDRLASGQPV